MFAEAWTEFLEGARELRTQVPGRPGRDGPRLRALLLRLRDADPVRNQLMNQRTIPGFEPSPEAYAPAVAVLDDFAKRLAAHGVTAQEDLDLCVALMGGLADSQLANTPVATGGDAWSRRRRHVRPRHPVPSTRREHPARQARPDKEEEDR